MLKYVRRSRRKNAYSTPELTLTPLIDTALTLLVIFMVTAPMLDNGIKIDLPKGQMKEGASKSNSLVINIDKNDALFFNSIPYTKDTIVNALSKELQKLPEAQVHIRADKATSYGMVFELFEKIKKMGGCYVVLDSQKSP